MWMSTARSWDCSETTNHRTVCPVVVNSYLAEIRIKYAMCFERMYARQEYRAGKSGSGDWIAIPGFN